VRDNIHSAELIRSFDEFFKHPGVAEVYNMGGGRFSNCSMLEVIGLCDRNRGQEAKKIARETISGGSPIFPTSTP
jgi:CDP-paratose 2-epimerase